MYIILTKEEQKKEFKYYCELCDFGVFAKTTFNIHKENKAYKRILERKNIYFYDG